MKKRNLFLIGICFLLLTGCTSKESKEVGNIGDFQEVGTNKQFVVIDNIESYSGIDYISQAYQATLDDAVIEMIIYTDSDNAVKVQEGQIKSFKGLKATGATEHKEKGENYYKFWMISNGYYMVSSRIDNTLIFSKTLLKNKENVEAILEDMNY